MALAHNKSGPNATTAIAERLERLEHKIDSLQAFERLSELQWRGLDSNGVEDRDQKSPRFEELTASFVTLLNQRNSSTDAGRGMPWTDGRDAELQSRIDELSDRLLAVASEIVTVPVATMAELRIKALAVQELVEEGSDDIVHRLASSIATDLFAMKDGNCD